MDKQISIDDLGVVDSPKFRNMWCNPYSVIDEDLSRETEEVFEEIAPFAIDAETGKLLNPTSVPMLVSKGFVNVHEKIQSFKDDVDIYTILNRMAAGDMSAFVENPQYGDISQFPSDLNGFAQYVNKHFKALDDLNPELAKMVCDKNVKAEDIEAKAKEIYDARVADFEASQNIKKEGSE